MSDQNCGNCDHQGYGVDHKKIECQVDGGVYELSHSCKDFKEYVQGKINKTRSAEAREIRREREARAKEQREREFTEKMGQMKMKHAKKLQRARLRWGGLSLLFGISIREILRLIF